ncbi:lantibiotic dehydratase [Pedobacter cryoconitis]|uniref:Thiopeptide-type bacteriocin biosynthesis protein n=1 Tax=Pedobacter cryoconitis TaxID=188932 RepID=A0A7X0J312_9SPHI|nr:lantibiotic dehydratase [Pedobacter cryoconitis]MBB6500143.1 thiopeptide-type bacteriocin biosynthesis protein [Pedobacter cryoconitis]
MKLTLSPVSISRTPVFSYQEDIHIVWDELKNYIHESSPSFYEMIRGTECSDLSTLDPKIRFTIWKYFNRAKYRATPFGNFAAFSIIPVNNETNNDPVTLSKKHISHRFVNWQEKENFNFDSEWLFHRADFLMANTTAYKGGDDLRYINIENGSFELSAIEVEETTLSTLDFCRTKRTVEETRRFLRKEHKLSLAMSNYFLEQLVDLQLLITDFQPNIIGHDYFDRIGYAHRDKIDDYIIAERKRIKGQLSERRLQVLTELTEFLATHTPASQMTSLDDFRQKFVKKFEQKEVPLQIAMDPEIGVGYGSTTLNKEEDLLVHELQGYRRSVQNENHNLSYTALHQFILNQMMQQKTIQLTDFKAPPTLSQLPVANTISILLQATEEHLIVEYFGGCTANSLLGRFTMASDEITSLGRGFVQTEQEANPDILFFDIAYQIEKHADNINRRKAIYKYELPILSWPQSQHVLDLDDIMLSVKGNELILHSVKYGKRIIPKLASAYNYARSDLAVYRFLSDLQHQGLRSYLGLKLDTIFPGLLHYQRIQYKNVILSPEKWLVPESVCAGTAIDQSLKALHDWLKHINLDKPFKCGVNDQTLVFDMNAEEDRHSFLLFCRNKKDLYIEEAFIPKLPQAVDENNAPYLPEFIVNLQHKNQLYFPYPLAGSWNKEEHFSDLFLPGTEWLYFEIYCHASKCNSILQLINRQFISPSRKQLKNWFFIRYNDPSYHIRLRLQLRKITDGQELTTSLSDLLAPYIRTGIIADLQVKIYRQETERYGLKRITLAEKNFGIDSDYVLSVITKPVKANDLYILSMMLMENVLHGMELTLQEQAKFAEQMHGNFSAEFKILPEGLKKINLSFKDFNYDSLSIYRDKLLQKRALQTERSFLTALASCPETKKYSLLADLFHMHVNRIFHDDQRMHEMIIYNYLTKRIKMKIGRLHNQNLVNQEKEAQASV